MRKNFLSLIFLSLFTVFFSSCSGRIGWSVILWTIPEQQIADGEIVPVYLKSNIQHIYVIENPHTKERIAVPLWQISEPSSKSQALKTAELHKSYLSQYARCAYDGLPIRESPINTSKQVYRLRKDEIIRLLYEGEGTAPTTGSQALEGKWLSVLTSDGHEGWCFSHNLKQFTMNADGSFGTGAQEAQIKEADKKLEYMLASTWYPEYYSKMINSKEINLEEMQIPFTFDPGVQSGTILIGWPNLSAAYTFSGITKVDDGVYKFDNTPVQVTIRSTKLITVHHTDSKGKPRSLNYITLGNEVDIPELIAAETERRETLFRNLKNQGPDFRSSGYGTLTFSDPFAFAWKNFDELVPSVISKDAKDEGTVSFKYPVPKALRARFDGIITFKFNGQQKEVSFFYKSESNGLRLTLASITLTPNDKTGVPQASASLPVNPEVIYFSK